MLKYLGILILLVTGFSSYSQVYDKPGNYGLQYKRLKADSSFKVPILTDTQRRSNLAGNGDIIYVQSPTGFPDTGFWIIEKGAYKKMIFDTSSISNRINQKLDTAAFGKFHRTYFDTSQYGQLFLFMFGDSFTVGSNATSFDSSYAGILSKLYGLPLLNRARSGAGLNWTCIQSGADINPNHRYATFVMSGFNDFRLGLTGALDSNKTIRKSINTALFVGANQYNKKTVAAFNGENVTLNGSWQIINSRIWGNKSTSAALSSTINNSISYTFVDSTLVVNVVGCDGESVTYSNYDILIDGNLYGTFNPNGQTDGGQLIAVRDTRGPVSHIIRGLSYSSHTVQVVNKQSDTLIVDCFMHLLPSSEGMPYYWAGIPILNNDSTLTARFISNYRSDSAIRANFYGYPYQRINPSIYYTTAGQDVDGIHPNNLGMKQFIRSIDDSINFPELPVAAFTVKTTSNKNLMFLGNDLGANMSVDQFGNGSFSSGKATISPYSFGSGYRDSNNIQYWLRSDSRPARFYTNNDTSLLQHASNNGTAGQTVSWVSTLRTIANLTLPNNFTTELLSNNLSFGNGTTAIRVGSNSSSIAFYGSAVVQGKIGHSNHPGPPITHYLYIASSDAATLAGGNQFKYVRFYPATMRTGIRTFDTIPTAHLHIGAGLATAGGAQLKLEPSPLLTVAERYAIEVDTTCMYQTNITGIRGRVSIDRTLVSSAATLDITRAYSHYVFSGTTTTWSLAPVATNPNVKVYIKNRGSGAITLQAATNTIYDTAPATSITINPGEARILFSDSQFWNVE